MPLEAEPYGSCYAHRLQLVQRAEPCQDHDDPDGLAVTVCCAKGCEVQDFHTCTR